MAVGSLLPDDLLDAWTRVKRGVELGTDIPTLLGILKNLPEVIRQDTLAPLGNIETRNVPSFEQRLLGGLQEFTNLPAEEQALSFMPGALLPAGIGAITKVVKQPWEMNWREFMRQEYPIYPALKDKGKIVPGAQGEAHWQIQRRLDPGWEYRSIDNGWVDRGGNWLTQREAAKIVQEIEQTPKGDWSILQGHSKYIDASARERHEKIIKKALKEGKQIPEVVLEDYPELINK